MGKIIEVEENDNGCLVTFLRPSQGKPKEVHFTSGPVMRVNYGWNLQTCCMTHKNPKKQAGVAEATLFGQAT